MFFLNLFNDDEYVKNCKNAPISPKLDMLRKAMGNCRTPAKRDTAVIDTIDCDSGTTTVMQYIATKLSVHIDQVQADPTINRLAPEVLMPDSYWSNFTYIFFHPFQTDQPRKFRYLGSDPNSDPDPGTTLAATTTVRRFQRLEQYAPYYGTGSKTIMMVEQKGIHKRMVHNAYQRNWVACNKKPPDTVEVEVSIYILF